jgi:hypothetical protein
LTLSHFIDLRFRPAVQVTRREVEKYYQEKLAGGTDGQPKPSLDDARPRIEQILTAERSDALFDAWLKDTRARTTIEYRKEVFNEDNQK